MHLGSHFRPMDGPKNWLRKILAINDSESRSFSHEKRGYSASASDPPSSSARTCQMPHSSDGPSLRETIAYDSHDLQVEEREAIIASSPREVEDESPNS